jgi:D,D-heptose 1,7-bisphosphate phosphatase
VKSRNWRLLTDALILAGGRGTRLGALTEATAKPILPVDGKPFLSYVLWNLKRFGIERAVISSGFAAESIEQALAGWPEKLGIQLEFAEEPRALGTGGAVRFCADRMPNEFLVLNGDTIFDANLSQVANSLSRNVDAVIALREVDDASRYGAATLQDSRIIHFGEKDRGGPGLISGGIYALRKSCLDRLPEGPSSIESDLFPKLALENRLAGVPGDGFFIDIGIPETYEEAQFAVPEWKRKPIAFLDRDGVINVDTAYAFSPAGFQFVDGAPEAIRLLNESGFLVIVITNQAGIGRGFYTEIQFHAFMKWINQELANHGAHFDGYYFCPHHPTDAIGDYRRECEFRKPNPGMLLQALEEWEGDPAKAIFIGDKESDMEAARRSQVRGILFEGGDLLPLVRQALAGP